MKKLSVLTALLCASLFSFADPELVYDVNFALASSGSSAVATSGTPAAAIDGNMGTRWEGASSDPQIFTLDMGQLRVFNTIQIVWEGAYTSSFGLSVSSDGNTWTLMDSIADQSLAGFPYEQTITLSSNYTGQYIRFYGAARGTGWGHSFWEFRVLLAGTPEVTSIDMSPVAKLNQAVPVVVKSQLGNAMSHEGITFTVVPATAGTVADGNYTALQYGKATLTASKDGHSASIDLYNVETDNLALNQPVAAGFSENTANLSNNGNANDRWGSNGATHYAADAENFGDWWYVDLGAKYDVLALRIKWETARPNDYDIRVSDDAQTWTTIATYETYPVANAYETYSDMIAEAGRYIGVWARNGYENLAYGISMYEFEVYGREYVASSDTEKPVMGTASLVSKTWNSAIISVAATDNDAIKAFKVTDSTNGIDKNMVATEGQITLTGLTASTSYNLTIHAVDMANNVSDNSATVAFTTNDHLTAPTAAAAAPTLAATDVLAVYSPTYNADCNFQDWGSGTVYTQEDYGKKFVLNGMGYFGMEGFSLDCSEMEKLHYDIWIDHDASVRIVPIWGGTEQGVTVSLTGEQWNAVDINLSDYTIIDNWTNIFQIKLDEARDMTIWIGNIYFFKSTSTGVITPSVDEPVKKFISNGTMYIVRGEHVFTVQGTRVR